MEKANTSNTSQEIPTLEELENTQEYKDFQKSLISSNSFSNWFDNIKESNLNLA